MDNHSLCVSQLATAMKNFTKLNLPPGKYLVEKWYIAQHQHEEKGTYIGPC